MDFMVNFRICASGLAAQRHKMSIISTNLSNAQTTRTMEGGPYKKKILLLTTTPVEGAFKEKLRDALRAVKVRGVVEDNQGMKRIYDPGHPDADPAGFVTMPNVNVVTEMADMILANRTYEACVTAFDSAKSMALKTIDIGR
ncbi:MAG: flagellar basal body rod protein FlgC [Syntrophales bacterium]|nr:flagellar basal body rod protein FlgC [Syntrophales bacterium]MDD5231804.1 flagellar basal body rod protein FlgC [Syntrophales bacterium]MDD5531214.1 flagellar basal body rod protein FlgC [Syntrophales bacterium]HPL62823.1 flagellar basal body rod protein FlgC [Syntrophales bacterium]